MAILRIAIDEFLGFMQYKGYEIKRKKYLYFKNKSESVFLNTKVLGSRYTPNTNYQIKKSSINNPILLFDDDLYSLQNTRLYLII